MITEIAKYGAAETLSRIIQNLSFRRKKDAFYAVNIFRLKFTDQTDKR